MSLPTAVTYAVFIRRPTSTRFVLLDTGAACPTPDEIAAQVEAGLRVAAVVREPITDPGARRAVLVRILERDRPERTKDLDTWVEQSPLVAVSFPADAA